MAVALTIFLFNFLFKDGRVFRNSVNYNTTNKNN